MVAKPGDFCGFWVGTTVVLVSPGNERVDLAYDSQCYDSEQLVKT